LHKVSLLLGNCDGEVVSRHDYVAFFPLLLVPCHLLLAKILDGAGPSFDFGGEFLLCVFGVRFVFLKLHCLKVGVEWVL